MRNLSRETNQNGRRTLQCALRRTCERGSVNVIEKGRKENAKWKGPHEVSRTYWWKLQLQPGDRGENLDENDNFQRVHMSSQVTYGTNARQSQNHLSHFKDGLNSLGPNILSIATGGYPNDNIAFRSGNVFSLGPKPKTCSTVHAGDPRRSIVCQKRKMSSVGPKHAPIVSETR